MNSVVSAAVVVNSSDKVSQRPSIVQTPSHRRCSKFCNCDPRRRRHQRLVLHGNKAVMTRIHMAPCVWGGGGVEVCSRMSSRLHAQTWVVVWPHEISVRSKRRFTESCFTLHWFLIILFKQRARVGQVLHAHNLTSGTTDALA